MDIIMIGTPYSRVGIGVPDGLEARKEVYKDLNLFVRGECNQGRIYQLANVPILPAW